MTIADFEKLLEESLEWQRKCDEAIKMRPILMQSLTDMSRKMEKILISIRSEKICLYNQLHS